MPSFALRVGADPILTSWSILDRRQQIGFKAATAYSLRGQPVPASLGWRVRSPSTRAAAVTQRITNGRHVWAKSFAFGMAMARLANG